MARLPNVVSSKRWTGSPPHMPLNRLAHVTRAAILRCPGALLGQLCRVQQLVRGRASSPALVTSGIVLSPTTGQERLRRLLSIVCHHWEDEVQVQISHAMFFGAAHLHPFQLVRLCCVTLARFRVHSTTGYNW